MTEGELAALASTDTNAARAACAAAVRSLRRGEVDDLLGLTARLAALYEHADERIRTHVAAACEFLPDPTGEAVLARLRHDDVGWVRAAADNSTKRRAVHKVKRAREAERVRSVRELLAQIPEKHRAKAERAVRAAEEGVACALHHELSKVMTPHGQGLRELREGLTSPRLDVERLTRGVERASERFELFVAINDSLGVYGGRAKPRFFKESARSLIDTAVGQLASRFRARVLDVTTEIPEGLALDVHRCGLLQAFQNVLENCVEAYGDATHVAIRISVEAQRAGSQIAFAFEDRGAGMGEAELRAMSEGGTTKEGGTGIGQIVMRKMIEEIHGGTIAVKSTVGEGTTVTITLPAHQRGVTSMKRGAANAER